MSVGAAPPAGLRTLTRRQVAWDVGLALLCVTVTVLIQIAEVDAVTANRAPDALSVVLTAAAVAPLALRRRAPLVVLAVCFPGLLGLIATRHAVGAATIGVIIGFYTAVAWGSRREARLAVAVLAAGILATALLRPIDLSLEGGLVQVALLVGGWVLGTGTRERREHHAARVAEAEWQAAYERELAAFEREQAARATMEERLRITRELHDILGHAFSVMVVQAGVAELLIDARPDEARRALTEIGTIGRTSLAEMRRLLRVLRDDDASGAPTRDPAPTLDDVPGLIARIRAAGLPVEFRVHGTPVAVPTGVGLAAYRVIQEALTNCVKHSRATGVRVDVTHRVDSVLLEVHNDGAAVRSGPAHAGQGLIGMRERVAMYGGELSAGAVPDGYLVRVSLPVGEAGRSDGTT